MKSEKNEKVNKRDYSVGTLHKKAIYNILFSRSVQMEGTTVDELHKILKLLPRTIYNNLDKLQAEDKVFKSKNEYYVKSLFLDNGWSVFAEYLKNFQRQYNLNKNPLRKIYSRGYIFHDKLENEIFNFGNMIGAFITYILVESLRPNEKATAKNRYAILSRFLQDAVNMNSIFLLFEKLLPQDSTNRLIMGFDNELFEKVISAYNNVYPGFSESLDYGFKEYIGNYILDKSCIHEWHNIRIHKIGDRYECRKCLAVIKEEDLEPISD